MPHQRLTNQTVQNRNYQPEFPLKVEVGCSCGISIETGQEWEKRAINPFARLTGSYNR